MKQASTSTNEWDHHKGFRRPTTLPTVAEVEQGIEIGSLTRRRAGAFSACRAEEDARFAVRKEAGRTPLPQLCPPFSFQCLYEIPVLYGCNPAR